MTITDRLSHRHNVGYSILSFETPEMRSDTAKPDLHLIGDTHAARFANIFKYLGKVSVRKHDLASTTHQRFDNERRRLFAGHRHFADDFGRFVRILRRD